MADEIIREINAEMKKNLQALFEKHYVPRIDAHVDAMLLSHIQGIIEKKIEERFSFAIELLRSMNPPKP